MKSIFLSSSGLKNVVSRQSKEDDFVFLIGSKEIHMNRFFAEFISPSVSHLNHSDPTNNVIHFDNDKYQDIFTQDMVDIIQQISHGYSIELKEDQIHKMRIISIIFDNQELFNKINELYSIDIKENDATQLLTVLQNFQYFSPISSSFNYTGLVEFISSHFFSFDKNGLLKLPMNILYSILSSSHLKIENEDSLLDFIHQIFSNDNSNQKLINSDNIEITAFYEVIEFNNLSEDKFREFLDMFDYNQITGLLWQKLTQCFYINQKKLAKNLNNQRYTQDKFMRIEYDNDTSHCFQGIIHYLTEKTGGNVDENGTIKVTASSFSSSENISPRNAVNLEDTKNYFHARVESNVWLKYDFKDRKVRPTHYSIRSRRDDSKGNPMNFVIEGSNTDQENDWIILDTQNNISYFNSPNSVQTFQIQMKLKENECFRYLRLRQTGPNTGGSLLYLAISALEYFGDLFDQIKK